MPPGPVLGLGGFSFYRHNAQIHTSYTVCCPFVRNLKDKDNKTGVPGAFSAAFLAVWPSDVAGDRPPVGDIGAAGLAG